MEKTITIKSCDICKASDKEVGVDIEKIQYSVVFTTEQNEGRPRDPHLYLQSLDVCEDCHKYLIDNSPLKGWGAQGYNTYQKTLLRIEQGRVE